jgi:predicted transcriptional regulator
MSEVESIWRSARPRPHLRRPSPGTTDVLLALAQAQPESGAAITPLVGRRRSNVSRWLRMLGDLGLAEIDFVIQGSRGGRAAEF